MFTISFLTSGGSLILLGDRFTRAEIGDLSMLFFADETKDGMFCFGGATIDTFIEWYGQTFPDRTDLRVELGDHLRTFTSVTMMFEPVLETESA